MSCNFKLESCRQLSKTSSQPAIHSLFGCLAYLRSTSMAAPSETLSSSQLKNPCLKLVREPRNHAASECLEVVAKVPENTRLSILLPISYETLHTDFGKSGRQMSQDILQQYEWGHKVQIPFHPSSDGSGMGYHTVPARHQILMPTPGPSENMRFPCVADEYRECCGIFGS